MKKASIFLCLFLSIFCLSAFIDRLESDKPVFIPPSKQRTGDAQKGWDYLVNGDYVKSGIPYAAFLFGSGKSKTNYLNRTGLNEKLSHEYTAIKAANGETLVAPNCLQCHAQVFDNNLIVGLGNSGIDFTKGQKLNVQSLQLLKEVLKRTAPRQYEASLPFLTVAKTIAPYLYTQVRGVNSADRLAAVLVAHRDPETFEWLEEAQLEIPGDVIPTDTPPWWLLKKKNAMFYNGFGRGDFGRFLMASNLLTVSDTSESRVVDEHMPDVLSYIYSIEPPTFPQQLNDSLVETGKILFQNNCSKCHGTYGTTETYPNLLIPESIIKTDSLLYRSNYSNPQFVTWFNKSWFTQGSHPASLQPFEGYIAPPLDGIWVTAPYLHNGSVPTLETLLHSKLRPRYWSRNFDVPQYDYEAVGWKFTLKEKGTLNNTYNTDLPGYGNYGHYFGDALTDGERKAVIEYLKTL